MQSGPLINPRWKSDMRNPGRYSMSCAMLGKAALLAGIVAMSGCSAIANRAADRLSSSLTAGVLDQDDTETVAAGLPAYLILLDGFIASDPDNAGLLFAGARMYSAYASNFVLDQERRKRLADRGFDYARRAMCVRDRRFCAAFDGGDFARFDALISAQKASATENLYVLATSWIGWLQADAGDWARIADLPRIAAVFARVVAVDPNYDRGNVQAYLGVLDCLRPESLGGRPQRGIDHLNAAFEFSQGQNLMPKTLLAEYCARLLFDARLHDRVLGEVLAADPHAPGLTLANTIARQRARELLETGKDYF